METTNKIIREPGIPGSTKQKVLINREMVRKRRDMSEEE